MSTHECEEINPIGARLREWRELACLSQAALGEIFGVDRKVIGNYEDGKTSPRADQLLKLLSRGADVSYIVTGQRMPAGAKESAVSYTPAQHLAQFISTLKLSASDAEVLKILAERLAGK